MKNAHNTYRQLRILFDGCVDLPDAERERWLEQHVTDADQRIELELMLAADRGHSGFLKREVGEHIELLSDTTEPEFDPESLVDRRFGAFVLKRLLGQGGQGTVYLAERVDSDFAQTAAVKLLRRGIHEKDEHRRFRREREILARFEHAGVARLIDGGVSGEGVPYLIMEYVEGVALDQWCSDQSLSQRARVALFGRLCEVVAAAHRALIVHRDIKPSNVLVTPLGEVKVLDFGIARLLNEDETQNQTATPIMTPGYGAPEQARGGVITLATDVHALGMLLRVLLTGSPPPMFPAELTLLPTIVPPELRWIVGKACAMESERRYRDATELGDDIVRFLRERPVLAHPPSRWYVTQKFINRHRGGVLTTVAVILGVLASAGVALWQAKLAREQAQRAEAARDFLVEIFQSAAEELPKDQRPTPQSLIEAAGKRLQLDEKLAPDVRADFYSTLASISFSTGAMENSLDYSQRALDLLMRHQISNREQVAAAQVVHAITLNGLGKTAEADQLAAGLLGDAGAQNNKVRVDALYLLVETRQKLGKVEDSLRYADEAVAVAEQIQGSNGDLTVDALTARATALYMNGQVSEALAQFEECLRRWKASGRAQNYAFASLLHNLGVMYQSKGEFVSAERHMQASLAIKRRIYQAPHEKIASTLIALGALQADRGEHALAARSLDEALAMFAALFAPTHPRFISALTAQGALLTSIGRATDGLPMLERAERLCAEGEHEQDPLCLDNTRHLVRAYGDSQRLSEADTASEKFLRAAVTIYGENHPTTAMALFYRAKILQQQLLWADSLTYFERAQQVFVAAGEAQGLTAANVMVSRAKTLFELKRYHDAYAALNEAKPLMSKLATNHRSALAMHLVAMRVCVALSKAAEAKQHAQSLLSADPKSSPLLAADLDEAERAAR